MSKIGVLEGTPSEIVNKLAGDLSTILEQAQYPVTGIHALALLHIAVSMIRVGNSSEGKDQVAGKMPEFSSILSTITRGLNDSQWTAAEMMSFDQDFRAMVESLGGKVLSAEELSSRKSTAPLIMSPHMGSC